ncbi:MAG: hypothetical protein OXB97_03470, partial [Rhodospirillales bacterium]|nr:hypothetical protein [Rhodospirillales bacterium]
ERDAGGAAAPDPQAGSQAEYRIELLLRALARHGAPCVLALDEVERLRSPEAASAINALLHRGPDNLHVGMAFREQPPGLELAMFALEGREAAVTVGDLRFSKADIARFFDGELSRRELDRVVAESAGWPLALRIHRNARRRGEAGGADRTVADWIETRLWRGVAASDRGFALDVALFDGLDPELVDEVRGEAGSGRRIVAMDALAGLLSTAGGGMRAIRLHPLVREYCEARRFREDPERYRAVHRGIALALARRGRAVEALRHAAEAGDGELLGRIAEDTGGVRLWLERGLEALCALDGRLTAELVWAHPRLALVRCVALTCAGEIAEARRVYGAAAAETASFTRDRADGDDRALRSEHVFVQGLLHMCGCDPYDEGMMAAILDVQAAALEAAETDPLLSGMFSVGICIAHNQRAAFDEAVAWAGRARAALGGRSPYLAHVDFQLGSVAMARGRADEAGACYGRALETARASHLRDAGAVIVGEALSAELALERSAGAPRVRGPAVSPRVLGECAAWFDVYAASLGVAAELALLRGGSGAALALVEDAREYARRTGRTALARFLAALRASVLAEGGEIGEAGRAWRFERLPEGAGECTDLDAQSWREAEMLSCARLRLLTAEGAFDAARELAAALHAAAAERGAVRMGMRGLALAAVLEHRAGEDGRARAHVAEYLRLYGETDYAWPLARERGAVVPLLQDIAGDRKADATVRAAAGGLRDAMADGADATQTWPLNGGEMEVLALLEWHSDKEIAETLKLSHDGVRSRLRRIFAALGARGRYDAVHRARAQGLLPSAEDAPPAKS